MNNNGLACVVIAGTVTVSVYLVLFTLLIIEKVSAEFRELKTDMRYLFEKMKGETGK